jgi:hypothetical protein
MEVEEEIHAPVVRCAVQIYYHKEKVFGSYPYQHQGEEFQHAILTLVSDLVLESREFVVLLWNAADSLASPDGSWDLYSDSDDFELLDASLDSYSFYWKVCTVAESVCLSLSLSLSFYLFNVCVCVCFQECILMQ